MADPFRQSLESVRNLVLAARETIDPATIPICRAERAHELLNPATHLIDDLLAQSPAATLGAKGGKATMRKLGPEHFRELAAKRKTRAGGRPKHNNDDSSTRKR